MVERPVGTPPGGRQVGRAVVRPVGRASERGARNGWPRETAATERTPDLAKIAGRTGAGRPAGTQLSAKRAAEFRQRARRQSQGRGQTGDRVCAGEGGDDASPHTLLAIARVLDGVPIALDQPVEPHRTVPDPFDAHVPMLRAGRVAPVQAPVDVDRPGRRRHQRQGREHERRLPPRQPQPRTSARNLRPPASSSGGRRACRGPAGDGPTRRDSRRPGPGVGPGPLKRIHIPE